MKEQVTSVEQSKRLIELGVPAEKASMVWFPEYKIGDNKLPIYPTGNYELVMKYKSFGDMEDKVIPAFTVADLLNIIPEGITYGRLHITRSSYSRGKDWRVFYKRVGVSKGAIVSFGDSTLICPACDMIEWLLANNYTLNI